MSGQCVLPVIAPLHVYPRRIGRELDRLPRKTPPAPAPKRAPVRRRTATDPPGALQAPEGVGVAALLRSLHHPLSLTVTQLRAMEVRTCAPCAKHCTLEHCGHSLLRRLAIWL